MASIVETDALGHWSSALTQRYWFAACALGALVIMSKLLLGCPSIFNAPCNHMALAANWSCRRYKANSALA